MLNFEAEHTLGTGLSLSHLNWVLESATYKANVTKLGQLAEHVNACGLDWTAHRNDETYRDTLGSALEDFERLRVSIYKPKLAAALCALFNKEVKAAAESGGYHRWTQDGMGIMAQDFTKVARRELGDGSVDKQGWGFEGR
jgi:hypothetical protein